MNAKILIVEDETIVAMELKSYLVNLGYTIIATVATQEEAYHYAIAYPIDIIIMDIYLKEQTNGIDAIKQIQREKPHIPVIFLSAYMDEKTLQEALSCHPIAYLVKPFDRKDLYTAIKLALSKKESPQEIIQLDEAFSYNPSSQTLFYQQSPISLNKQERILLDLFIQNPNQILSNERIEHTIWQDKPVLDGTRRALISRLRNKLHHKFIKTYATQGYFFELKKFNK